MTTTQAIERFLMPKRREAVLEVVLRNIINCGASADEGVKIMRESYGEFERTGYAEKGIRKSKELCGELYARGQPLVQEGF